VPRAIGPPHLLGAPYRLSPTQDVAVVLTTYSESAKAANLRNRPVSSSNRYNEKASPSTNPNGETELLHRGTVGRPWRSTRFILQFTSSHIQTSRSVHSKRRPKSF